MLRKKKILLATTGLLVGVSVFSITAFSALANNSVYDNYKKALIKTYEAENMNIDVKMSVTNQDALYTLQENNNKIDKNKYYTSTEIKQSNGLSSTYGSVDDGETVTYFSDGKIIREKESYSETYYDKRVLTDAQKKLIDVGIDTLLGDTKNSIISDGNKVIADLEEHQIPGIVQALFSVLAESSETTQPNVNYEGDPESKIFNELLSLNNLSIKKASGSGEIDDNGFIKSLLLKVEVGGYDSSNNYKNTVFDFELNISDIGSTVVEIPKDLPRIDEDYSDEDDEEKNASVTINDENGDNIKFAFDNDEENLDNEINGDK